MIIIVNASAVRSSGGLSIYRQFISYLPRYTDNVKYYIFIDKTMDAPKIKNVVYVFDNNHSWKHRIWWDWFGLNKWLINNSIHPDVIVSLQNTGVNTNCKQVIYYHQSLPFYSYFWNPLRKNERLLFLYKYIYPLFVSFTLNNNTDVVVQIPFIKDKFLKRFNISEDSIHVLFPDIEVIKIDEVTTLSLEKDCVHFVYPAVPMPYKNHSILVKAVKQLMSRNKSLGDRIRIHFTFTEKDFPDLYHSITSGKLEKQFVFEGTMNHNSLLSLYKSSKGMLFPSLIETLGLPLLECAAFGLPVLVSDIPYAREVLNDYDGAKYLPSSDVNSWSSAIEVLCLNSIVYPPLKAKPSSWPFFFELLIKYK